MFHSWNDSERYIQASVATIGTIGRKHCKKGGLQPNQFRVNIMNSVSCGLETEVKKNKNIFKKKKKLALARELRRRAQLRARRQAVTWPPPQTHQLEGILDKGQNT